MFNVLEATEVEPEASSLWADVIRVCNQFPPLWDLQNYVAVNPFLGFAGQPFQQAARIVQAGLDARVLPGLDFYRQRWQASAFTSADLQAAADRNNQNPQELANLLAGTQPPTFHPVPKVFTFAEQHDREHHTDWNDQLSRSEARWCAVYSSNGGTYWKLPFQKQGLYGSWLEAARVDHALEFVGFPHWRAWAKQLPAQPKDAIAAMLQRLQVSPEVRFAYLYRLLGGLFGWACYFRRAAWEQGNDEPGQVADLLAIRLCSDAAVADQSRTPMRIQQVLSAPATNDTGVVFALQEALEDGFARTLISKLAAPPNARTETRPAVQAIFCIDVRSEPLRRHLEAQSAEIETRGFAGFFGVPLQWQATECGSARCPVLLKPGVSFRSSVSAKPDPLSGLLKHLQTAPAASFSFVELLGLVYGGRMTSSALAVTRSLAADGREPFAVQSDGAGAGVDLEGRVGLAQGILKNMGFQHTFARLVLLCGHEGHSTNNPHAAGLDCGACGGHGGAINARVAAALLNDPQVRGRLVEHNWQIPADTHFLPAVHDTSVDAVELLDLEQLPSSHRADIERLKLWLQQAGKLVRSERSKALGLANQPESLLDRLLQRRARDWSEVRPEWALARNAAFIAARRIRTRGVHLEGRAFLHEYDAANDSDNSILSLILSAPMVVASWINLQYFASTVDNDLFGAGTKTLHNRVGSLGVVLGNGGDLRTGLAAQSVHAADGSWFHEPLRLQVIVEAQTHQIDTVLGAQPGVNELIENGWVRLFALDPHGNNVYRRVPQAGWKLNTAAVK